MTIKFCTFFSESHKVFYKLFMNSFPYENDVDLIVRYLPQECSGNYNQDDWNLTMKKKVKFIVDYLSTLKDGEYLIHSDIDVVFYKPFKNNILDLIKTSNNDILFQNDGCALCMGFFVCNNNPEILKLMTYIYENLDNFENDQVALNVLIRNTNIKFGVLPLNYYCFGPLNKMNNWNPNYKEEIFVPSDIILHHANWTIGVENKLKLIQTIKKKLNENTISNI